MKVFLILILLGFYAICFSQDTTYLDNSWKRSGKSTALYYRVADDVDSLFSLSNSMTGMLKMKGYYSKFISEIFDGEVNWYTIDGEKIRTQIHDKGICLKEQNYRNGKPLNSSGRWGVFSRGRRFSGIFLDIERKDKIYEAFTGGSLFSIFNIYQNSDQKAYEIFYKDDIKIIERNYYTKNGEKYVFVDQEGIKLTFWEDGGVILGVKSKTPYTAGEKNGKEITYKKNGRKWLKCSYKKGKPWNGKILDKLTMKEFKNGLESSEYVYYNSDLVKVAKAEFKNGKPFNGSVVEYKGFFSRKIYYENGIITRMQFFYSSLLKQIKEERKINKNGYQSTFYDENGNKMGSGTTDTSGKRKRFDGFHRMGYTSKNYKNGKYVGLQKWFNEDGELIKVEKYDDDGLFWIKTYNPFYDKWYYLECKDSSPFKGFEYLEIQSGNFFLKHYENGKIIETVKYVLDMNFKFRKVVESYGEDLFNPKMKITFFDSKPDTLYYKGYKDPLKGVVNNYFYTTQMTTFQRINKLTYKNGILDGPYTYYYGGNKLLEKGNFKNGKRHGTIYFFHPDKGSSACIFDYGKAMNGIVKTPFESAFYENGYLEGKREIDSYVGKIHIVESIYYKKNLRDGICETFFKTGVRDVTGSIITDKGQRISGTYKNDKPYDGKFFNKELKTIDVYHKGIKE